MSQYGGIDIGKHKSYACRIEFGKKKLHFPTRALTNQEIVDWFDSHPVQTICIDGPPQPNRRVLAKRLPANTKYNTVRRVAEFTLKIYGCYGTPSRKPSIDSNQGWMRNSMDLYHSLSEKRHCQIDLGSGEGELMETHPTYAFKSLLGYRKDRQEGEVQQLLVDPQALLRPKRPRKEGGHDQRRELLKLAFQQLDIPVTAQMEEYWEASIDHVDATLCALMALWRDTGTMQLEPIGDPEEGSIYITNPEKKFKIKSVPSVPAKRKSVRKLDPMTDQANAVILRLGENGPGGASQAETIDLAQLAIQEGDRWLPVDTSHSFKLREHLEHVDHDLYLAFGEVLQLRIRTGDVVFNPGCNIDCPASFSPWKADASHGWVEMLDAAPVNITSFETIQKKQWKQGFSGRGNNLLKARVDPAGGGQ